MVFMRRLLLVAALVLMAVPGALAQSPSYAAVHAADGTTLASASGAEYDFPEDGSIVHVGAAQRPGAGIQLDDVVLFGGRLRAVRVRTPDRGFAGLAVEGLIVDGTPVAVGSNTVVALPGIGYLVAAQAAVVDGSTAAVGLRVHTLAPIAGLPTGTEVLIGPSGAQVGESAAPSTSGAISVLGFSLTANGLVRVTRAGYPLGVRGKITACPFTPGSTHSPFAPPANLESDNAVDINVAVGTAVLAVADGVIGSQIGSLNSTDPRMQGSRLHLNTPTSQYYYAHLSRIDVSPGQFVRAGQQVGLSGSAAGVAHLHFAQDVGNPADTIGESSACPFFVQYDEAW
jgi:hypothetical protein